MIISNMIIYLTYKTAFRILNPCKSKFSLISIITGLHQVEWRKKGKEIVMKRFNVGRCHLRRNICVFLISAALVLIGCTSNIKTETGKVYHQIVVLSDVHIPGNNLPVKEKVLQTVNSWKDVDMVAVTGDIVATGGISPNSSLPQRVSSAS